MSYKCEVSELVAQPTLAVRTRTSVENMSSVLGQAYGKIFQYLGELGEHPAGPPFVVYFNEDMENLEIAAGLPVARDLEGRGDVEASELPGGKAATCLHIGPYRQIDKAYAALTEWIGDHGYEVAGAPYEMYLNDPQETPEEELQTQVVFPIK